MSNQEEMRVQCVDAMGSELGDMYCDLNEQLLHVLLLWKQVEQLFCQGEEVIEILNSSAPLFFNLVQMQLTDAVLLGIARLHDPASTNSNKNVSLLAMLPLVNEDLREQINVAISESKAFSGFAIKHRSKRIAHNDLQHCRRQAAIPLPKALRVNVLASLDSICAVLELVSRHHRKASTLYDRLIYEGGAGSVVRLLKRGLKQGISES